MNSEKRLSSQHRRVTKKYERYGFEFVLHVMEEERPQWERVLRDCNGQRVTEEDKISHPSLYSHCTVDWEKTDESVITSWVQSVLFKDEQFSGKPIKVYNIFDGPVMGIEAEYATDKIHLWDPCMIKFDARQGIINLLPIFNVGRELVLYKSAVRAESAPSEVLVTAYPGFIIENRMSRHQLKPLIPFASSPPLDNDAKDSVSIKV